MTRAPHHEQNIASHGGRSEAEQRRAYDLMIREGRDQYQAARILTAERKHGAKPCTAEEAQELCTRERNLQWGRAL